MVLRKTNAHKNLDGNIQRVSIKVHQSNGKYLKKNPLILTMFAYII